MILSIIDTLLNLVFPRNATESEIEHLTLPKLLSRAGTVEDAPSGVTALLPYRNDTVRELIRLLKYKQGKNAVDLCATLFLDAVTEEVSNEMEWSGKKKRVLIPIPMSPARLKARGYNQIEWLSERILTLGGDTLFELDTKSLIRVKETPPQSSIKNRALRLKNMIGVFALSREANIQGKSIVLLDDVTTTGATLREAKKILLAGGARRVECISIAH